MLIGPVKAVKKFLSLIHVFSNQPKPQMMHDNATFQEIDASFFVQSFNIFDMN